jgi:serine/threonine protein kinase
MQSIEREIDTWRRLRHPNIAQLYEVIVSESKIFMVMEYAGGGEVLSYIKQLDGPLPGQLAKRLFLQLILAVKYCHDRMVVHR